MNIKNLLSSILKKKTKTVSVVKTTHINAYSYWKKIIILIFVVLAIVLILAISTVLSIDSEIFISQDAKNQVKNLEVTKLHEDNLKKIITEFDKREINRDAILTNREKTQDPSIILNTQINNSESGIGLNKNGLPSVKQNDGQ